MMPPILALPVGATIRLTSPKGYFSGAFTLAEPFRSFGVPWQSSAALTGEGSPVLFYSEIEERGANIGRGFTLRIDVGGVPTFYAVEVTT